MSHAAQAAVAAPEQEVRKELLLLTHATDIREALLQLKMLPNATAPFSIEVHNKWQRGGGETYILRFSLIVHDGISHECIFKACVPFSLGTDLTEIFQKWLARRELLTKHGIETPRLYGVGSATLLEEYIPHCLEDVFAKTSTRLKMFKDLGIMVGTIAKLKFNPIEVVSDLRSRSSDIVMIDFGEDLGPSGEPDVSPLKIMNDAFESLKRWEPSLTVEEERSFESGFHQGLCHYTS